MLPRHLLLLCLVPACSSETTPPYVDPCAEKPVVAGGSAELGLGSDFMPVADGQNVTLQLGAQGLWMFVVTARARDMDVGSGDRQGVIDFSVRDQSGGTISLALGCRVREFAEMNDGYLGLTTPFALPLLPDASSNIEGARVTIHLEVRDTEGRRAIDDRTVVAHFPAATR